MENTEIDEKERGELKELEKESLRSIISEANMTDFSEKSEGKLD